MKKILFYLAVFVFYLILGVITWKYIYMGPLADNAEFFSTPTKAEKRKSYLLFFGPIVAMIVLEAVILLLGRKCFDTWGWKDRILTIAASVAGAVVSLPLLTFFGS